MDAGRVLRESRLRAGLTQREVAEKAGVPQSVVARVENRGRIPRVDTLDRLLGPCGLALSVEARLGGAVDRQQIRDLLARPARARIRGLRGEVPGFHALRILQVVAGRGVRFVLVGGLAERAHGSPYTTDAVEIVLARERWNDRRLELAVKHLRKGRFVKGRLRWRWTAPRPLTYPQLERTAREVWVGTRFVRVAALDDLIAIRRAHGFRIDLERLEVLGAVQEEGDRLALARRRPAR